MEKVNSLEAWNVISDGGIVESGERYYRYNSEEDEIQYSDYNTKNWKPSNTTVDEFLKIEASWNVNDKLQQEDDVMPKKKYKLRELGSEKELWKKAVVVFTEGSFKKDFSKEERSYEISSDAKYFDGGMNGNSLFGDCLDGKDMGVRLDHYISSGWIVDYCYIVESE